MRLRYRQKPLLRGATARQMAVLRCRKIKKRQTSCHSLTC